ncbi:MAG: S9 family peptidase [Myxococcaceae bacterium]|jgi:dipeptidyl aminopeptidase/acylaminoacyl peptidase|nr:S9 family peptidase [Myxococcaceae bacterium]MCA3011606.1 S9 family peptidase [Myxococcaceae bacterium]
MLSTLLLAALLAQTPPKPRPYTVQDQVTLRRLLAFKVSPDGSRLVYQLRTTDLEANKGLMDLWLADADGKNARPLTTDAAADTDPVWAPDGKSVFFLSSRGGSSQVWRLSLEGGEPTRVTAAPVDVDAFTLSRDGSLVAFAAETFPDCDSLDCTKKRLDEKAKSKATGRLYERLFVRHWDTWKDGRRAHLFVQKVSGGPAIDVTKGLAADAPPKPFGGAEEFTFTPDGKALVFTARDVGRQEAWSTDLDLFVTPADGAKAPVKLTTQNRATDTQPTFSPDGSRLAYLAMSRPGYEADKLRVMVRDWPKGPERSLTDGWDRSPHGLAWSKDGKTLYVWADDLGQAALFAVDAASGAVTRRFADGSVSAVDASSGKVVFSRDSLTAPADLWALGADGTATQLTQVNGDVLPSLKLGQPEPFTFKGALDETVHAYVVRPVDFDPKKKYPLAFLIHGGPQGSFGNHWHYRWNPQVYAARGYVAVMVDFHGSTGYGQAFTDAINGDWGGKPLEDLQKGLAAALSKYPFIDKDRLCALGASYGGFMINWMAGTWNEPWKCLVNHDGNLDEHFAYYDTEELWFPEWEHGGPPWENRAGYGKHNPIDHVAKWKVPMLVVHGGKDFRVVDTQGLSTFTVLQRRGIPSRFLHFPDENHWVLKPANSVLWHETVLDWLDTWTKKK